MFILGAIIGFAIGCIVGAKVSTWLLSHVGRGNEEE